MARRKHKVKRGTTPLLPKSEWQNLKEEELLEMFKVCTLCEYDAQHMGYLDPPQDIRTKLGMTATSFRFFGLCDACFEKHKGSLADHMTDYFLTYTGHLRN